MAQKSTYTPFGQSFHDDATKDAMWRNAPHPHLITPVAGYGRIDDFLSYAEDEWTVTVVSVGTGDSTIALTAGDGGLLRVNTAANENDGAQAQSDVISFNLTTTNNMWIDFAVDITDDVTQSDAFVGLAVTDTTIIAGVSNDIIYWHKDDGDTNWDFTSRASSTSTDVTAAHTSVIDTRVILGWHWDGTTLTPYVDGVAKTDVTTNVPTATDLRLSFGYLNGAAAAQNEGMNLDWIRYAVTFDRS